MFKVEKLRSDKPHSYIHLKVYIFLRQIYIISFMKKAIIFSFAFIVAYTIWTQIAISMGITLNDTITQCVFAFFGTEIIIMCAKKMFNMYLDNKKENNNIDHDI